MVELSALSLPGNHPCYSFDGSTRARVRDMDQPPSSWGLKVGWLLWSPDSRGTPCFFVSGAVCPAQGDYCHSSLSCSQPQPPEGQGWQLSLLKAWPLQAHLTMSCSPLFGCLFGAGDNGLGAVSEMLTMPGPWAASITVPYDSWIM